MLALLPAIVQSPADLTIVNATVWTNGRATPNLMVAVKGGRITYVGKSDAWRAGPLTERIDAKGRMLLPGLIDSHCHLQSGGIRLRNLNLTNTLSQADFLERIAKKAKATPAGEWVVGNGWSAESWPERTQPNRDILDPVTGDHPVALYRMDGHSVLLNSKALELMKITNEGPANPTGGSIDRDGAGRPTGLLRETAMSHLRLPSATPEQISAGFREAVKLANSFGITAASEIGSVGGLSDYTALAAENRTIRLGIYLNASDWRREIDAARNYLRVAGWSQINGIKIYMDGTLGSRTAFMFDKFTKPLPDQTSPTGLARPGFENGTYASGIRMAADAGLQVICHAIGDRANSEILSLYDKNAAGLAARRFRVEHCQHLAPTDIRRFAKLGVIASLQPYHKADDGRYCEEVIGTDRSRTSYAYRQLLDSKARLAFGSDWPVVTNNPWLGIEAAVTGRIQTGKVWMPHQNITIDEALTAYTSAGAYALRMENEIGQIKPGFRADFALLPVKSLSKQTNWAKLMPDQVWVEGQALAQR